MNTNTPPVETDIPDHAAAMARAIPAELHPHDRRIVAVLPHLTGPTYPFVDGVGYDTEAAPAVRGYGDAAIVTQDDEGWFWTTLYRNGAFDTRTTRKFTTIRLAIRAGLAMSGW